MQYLCVGGQYHHVPASTLAKEPDSLLAGLVGVGRYSGYAVPKVPHVLVESTLGFRRGYKVEPRTADFIDRDPKHFQSILNFLRDGQLVAPARCQERLELVAEARFYKLTKLVEALESLPVDDEGEICNLRPRKDPDTGQAALVVSRAKYRDIYPE